MRIVLQINQGVRKVILRNPNCESLYMYALNVISVGGSFHSVEWQKSWLITIPLLSLVYDHDSQYYSRMSIVKNIDLAYQYWTSYKSIHSELIRFQAFENHCTRLGSCTYWKFYHGFFLLSDLRYITYTAFHLMFTLWHSVEIAPDKINVFIKSCTISLKLNDWLHYSPLFIQLKKTDLQNSVSSE